MITTIVMGLIGVLLSIYGFMNFDKEIIGTKGFSLLIAGVILTSHSVYYIAFLFIN